MNKNKVYYGIHENDSYKFEDYSIIMIKEEYVKTDSKKSWKSKPIESHTYRVGFREYFNVISSVDWFRNVGSYQRVEKSYTIAGYIPTEITSISPDKTSKVKYKFMFHRKEK